MSCSFSVLKAVPSLAGNAIFLFIYYTPDVKPAKGFLQNSYMAYVLKTSFNFLTILRLTLTKSL
ncbi:hypothetical protein DPQ25_13110 [Hydrogeniiclostridium mannosilyticum]|uniref:Uncharacterized protein n=1 Tax=Hydrogeniiclostridium mannosilyticum TaxID=2764322 RepID=A0A328UEW5_9FIRM|nr:hypothetical protein DPQ25_13110 [Hydrogeniiclostridium mannosilyticum]